jgi:hypothetical protein
MYLSTDEVEQTLESGGQLAAQYVAGDPGRLTLRHTDQAGSASSEVELRLEPWAPEGFLVHEWAAGGALAVCGASRLLILAEPSLELRAAVPWEYGECEVGDFPYFVTTDGAMLIATETRVFCVDDRLAFRWCWTVKVYSNDWWKLAAPPRVEADKVSLLLRSASRDVTVVISIADGSS